MKREVQTVWRDSDGKDLFRLNPDNSVYVIPMVFAASQIGDMIEALEDARDLIDEGRAKAETKRILAGSVS